MPEFSLFSWKVGLRAGGNPMGTRRIENEINHHASKTASAGIYLQAEGVNMVEYQGLMVMGKCCADLCQAF